MIVVSNTSPITNLASIGQLEVLRRLHQHVIIAEAVYRELMAEGGQHPGAVVQSLDWIETRVVTNRLLVTALRTELDEGEAETIVLAQELAADLVLMDERRGRAAAGRFGLRVLGVLGVLLEARHSGLIPAVKPLLDALRHGGFWIRQELYDRVLQAAGE